MKKIVILLVTALITLVACSGGEIAPTLVITPIPSPVEGLPPTFTPPKPSDRFFPTEEPRVTVTQLVMPTRPTNTPIPFGDTAVEVHLQISALDLDRRMQGSISSQLIMVDETTGNSIKRSGQAGVILDLQQVLPELLLPVIPEGCDTCVFISYDLPFANMHDEGWLRDPVLLASLENYLTIGLGPHFPPGTIAGLRRSASPFAPAHSIALTEDGLVFLWLATENEVGPPIPADPALIAAFEDLPIATLQEQYVTSCAGSPLETMYLKKEERQGTVGIICPEYTLPSSLLPLYSKLDEALAVKLAESDAVIERPPTVFPLTAVLDYKRIDGAGLTIFQDGTAVARDTDGNEFTAVISSTQVISLTEDLMSSGAVRTGLRTFNLDSELPVTNTDGVTVTLTATPKPPRSVLLLRGPNGVYDGEWFNRFNVPELLALNELLGQIISAEVSESEELPDQNETETPDVEGTGTAEPESTSEVEAGSTPTP